MKAIQFNTANVVKSAIKCMGYEMDEATSISKGIILETLKKRMMRGEVVRTLLWNVRLFRFGKDGMARVSGRKNYRNSGLNEWGFIKLHFSFLTFSKSE